MIFATGRISYTSPTPTTILTRSVRRSLFHDIETRIGASSPISIAITPIIARVIRSIMILFIHIKFVPIHHFSVVNVNCSSFGRLTPILIVVLVSTATLVIRVEISIIIIGIVWVVFIGDDQLDVSFVFGLLYTHFGIDCRKGDLLIFGVKNEVRHVPVVHFIAPHRLVLQLVQVLLTQYVVDHFLVKLDVLFLDPNYVHEFAFIFSVLFTQILNFFGCLLILSSQLFDYSFQTRHFCGLVLRGRIRLFFLFVWRCAASLISAILCEEHLFFFLDGLHTLFKLLLFQLLLLLNFLSFGFERHTCGKLLLRHTSTLHLFISWNSWWSHPKNSPRPPTQKLIVGLSNNLFLHLSDQSLQLFLLLLLECRFSIYHLVLQICILLHLLPQFFLQFCRLATRFVQVLTDHLRWFILVWLRLRLLILGFAKRFLESIQLISFLHVLLAFTSPTFHIFWRNASKVARHACIWIFVNANASLRLYNLQVLRILINPIRNIHSYGL